MLYILPRPPAWASIIDAETGVPGFKPKSLAAFVLKPLPQFSPGFNVVVPDKKMAYFNSFTNCEFIKFHQQHKS